ncbi:MAG: glycerophosphodiester phosphodiesterase [Opitutus sp.]|nr:glycerophosphodiester phosphodiesterase [Opitutus sp.]
MKTILVSCLLAASAAFAADNRPLVIAHRGASGYLPEHTLAAKAYAHALGADFLEQDLVLTKDDVPVVLHDIYLDTVTDVAKRFPDRKRADGRFYALDLTLAELKQLRVTERFNVKTGKLVFAKRFPAEQSEFHIATLEEELQLIQGLNRSTGRTVGIYPEIKQPKWHREQGHDISRLVLPILARYGYATKTDACFLQCFELVEVRRMRGELGWQGRLVMLIEAGAKGADGTDHTALCTDAGLRDLARVVDGIGPAIARIVTWPSATERKISDLVKLAHAAKLVVHPYTIRLDDLPKNCPSVDELHAALFRDAGIDGVFTDFTDVTMAWLKK